MTALKIKVGTRFELELINDSDESMGYFYVSQLVEMIDSSNIVIASPIHENRMLFIPLNAKLRVSFLDDIQGLLNFTGVVTNKGKRDNLLVLFLKLLSKIEKIQRRKHFRLDSIIPAQYYVCNPSELPSESKGCPPSSPNDQKTEFKKALTKNISASGTCLIVNEEILEGTILKVSLSLNTQTTIQVECKVMRSINIGNEKFPKFQLGLYFLNMSPYIEDHVTKYIFDQQRLLIKKV